MRCLSVETVALFRTSDASDCALSERAIVSASATRSLSTASLDDQYDSPVTDRYTATRSAGNQRRLWKGGLCIPPSADCGTETGAPMVVLPLTVLWVPPYNHGANFRSRSLLKLALRLRSPAMQTIRSIADFRVALSTPRVFKEPPWSVTGSSLEWQGRRRARDDSPCASVRQCIPAVKQARSRYISVDARTKGWQAAF